MDDKLILKTLSAIPTDSCVLQKNLDGATTDLLNDLQSRGLIEYKWSMEIRNHGYRRTTAGTDWIREYKNQKQTEEYQQRIEMLEHRVHKWQVLATFFGAVAAFPILRRGIAYLLCLLN